MYQQNQNGNNQSTQNGSQNNSQNSNSNRINVPEARQVCRLGKGVAVSFMDNGSIVTRKLYKSVIDIAEKNHCHYQIKEAATGGNDASAYQAAADAKATCVLSVPCRYIHGPSSVVKLSDVEDQLTLARHVVNSL